MASSTSKTILSQLNSSRWLDFLNIKKDQGSYPLNEGDDLLVGENTSLVLTLDPGSSHRLRDIVVLGTLMIKSSDLSGSLPPPKLEARHVFSTGTFRTDDRFDPKKDQTHPSATQGNLTLLGIDSSFSTVDNYPTRNMFLIELTKLFLSYHEINKLEARKMGLVSILA